MQKFTYYAPTEIVFGPGTEMNTGALVKKYGGSRVLVVYGGQSAVRSGLIDRILGSLKEAGIEAKAAGGVVPNPLLSTARKMVEEACAFEADFILAAGGGSVIDTAKATAIGAANPGKDLWSFWTGRPVQKSLPVAAVVTIAAAGSETSNSAVLTNDEVEPRTKRGLNGDFNRCRFAVMNPELTMSLPKYQIGAGAADIFMHTSERYFSPVRGNHLTDEIAEGVLRDIMIYGPAGVRDSSDYEAMSEIMWCGSVSHVGLTGLGSKGDGPREGDWSCHQLGHALSALFNATHGATLTAVWGSWASYVCHEDMARFARFARKVCGVTEEDDALAAEQGIEKAEEFFRSLGMPLTITELLGRDLTEDEVRQLAEECSYGKTRTVGSMKVLSFDDMVRIYDAAR